MSTAEAWASSFGVTFGPEIAARSRDIAELKKSCIPVIMQGRNELGTVRNNFTRQEADKVCGCIGEAGAGQAFIKYATQAEALSPVEAIIVQQITGGCVLNLNLEGFAKGMPR